MHRKQRSAHRSKHTVSKKTEVEMEEIADPATIHRDQAKGTERAFTGAYWDNHEAGNVLLCLLFENPYSVPYISLTAGTGWLQFLETLDSILCGGTGRQQPGYVENRSELAASAGLTWVRVFNDILNLQSLHNRV